MIGIQNVPGAKNAPLEIPKELLDAYTMNGAIPVRFWYLNDVRDPNVPRIYTREMVDQYIARIKRKEPFYYGETDIWLHEALKKYSILGMEVAVMGSGTPWYESFCLAYGAKPTTIEYNRIVSKDERLQVMTVEEYEHNPIKFDATFSISSFEHDGLGRYGDPLNPNGDLDAMEKMKLMVNPGGLLFLAVPIGQDVLAWNAHRIYGPVRLPKLIEHWKVLDIFGKELMRLDGQGKKHHQPVFVLQNTED